LQPRRLPGGGGGGGGGGADLAHSLMVLKGQLSQITVPQVLQEVLLGDELELAGLDAKVQAGLHRPWTGGLHRAVGVGICAHTTPE